MCLTPTVLQANRRTHESNTSKLRCTRFTNTQHILSQDIPRSCVPTLAEILQFRADEGAQARSKRITQTAKGLPWILKPSLLGKLLLLPTRGHLCQLHKVLDFPVVEAVLRHVQLEAGIRLNNVVSQCQLLSPEQYTRVMRLRSLHALWLDPEQYEKTFLSSTKELKWSYQVDGCEACILSRITGDLEVLLDLRWAMRSRATSRFVAKHGNPRLEVWVQTWLEKTMQHLEMMTSQQFDLDAAILRNEEQAMAFKRMRAKIHSLRKNKLKIMDVGGKKGVAKVGHHRRHGSDQTHQPLRTTDPDRERIIVYADKTLFDDAAAADDIPAEFEEEELEEIDTYTALTSTPYLPMHPNPHAKHRQTLMASASASVSADTNSTDQSPYQDRYRMPERESVYSDEIKTIDTETPGASRHLDSRESEYHPPPMQMWNKKKPEPSRYPTSSHLHTPESSRTARTRTRSPADTYVAILPGSSPFITTTTTPAASTRESDRESSWGDMYESQVHLREDLRWFYGGNGR